MFFKFPGVMKIFLALLFLFLLSNTFAARTGEEEKDKSVHRVMVISLDGFGHNYLTKYDFQHLNQLFLHGSYPEVFRNQFITKTFPNHFSMATGVYEETHGVVANVMYDPDLDKTLHHDDEEFFTQNPGIIPIWTLNEEHGGHTACLMWPGCDKTYRGRNVTYWTPYREDATFRESIDKAVEWMTDATTPANLVFLYVQEPDTVGHAYGPNSSYVVEELKKIDENIGYLYKMLTIFNLLDTTDVIVLSDHGMVAVLEENIIDLDQIVDPKLYHTSGGSPVMHIWPYGDLLDLYIKFDNGAKTHKYTVYQKKNFPSGWHYTNNSRISRLVLVADVGYVFQDWKSSIENYKKKGLPGLTNTFGDHGYPTNTSEMEPIFVAAGPSFKRGFKAPSFSNVDVYPLLCHLLSLPPGPNNGTLKDIGTVLSHPAVAELAKPLLIALGCLVILVGLIGILACVLSRRDRRAVSADSLINGYVHRRVMRSESSKLADDDASEEECLLESEVVTVEL